LGLLGSCNFQQSCYLLRFCFKYAEGKREAFLFEA